MKEVQSLATWSIHAESIVQKGTVLASINQVLTKILEELLWSNITFDSVQSQAK